MEEKNLNESLDERSLSLNDENTEQNNNFNGRSPLVVADTNVLIEEQELIVHDEPEKNILIDLSHEKDINIPSNTIIHCNHDMEIVNKATTRTQTSTKLSTKKGRYLSSWEQKPESFYKTYTFDRSNHKYEKLLCWLYNKKDEDGEDGLGCRLCETHHKRLNSNGKLNLWCTSSYQTLKLSKIRNHKESEVHKKAQQLEIETVLKSQPDWKTTQIKERTKHEASIQNLILSAVFVCQQDQSIKSFEKLCILTETLGVKLLPAEASGVSYRNDTAALEFLHHVSSYLHEEVVEKAKRSPSLGKKLI